MVGQNRIVIITGASRGLGLAIAQEFAGNGWYVIGTGRSEKHSEFPSNGEYHQFDASDPEACEAFWEHVSAQHTGAAYCLVNNAGGYISGSLTKLRPEDYLLQMQSTYFSAVYTTRGMALLIPQARIINVISSSALGIYTGDAAYGSAKAAEMHFFQVLQKEFKPGHYRITNLYPTDIASQGPNPRSIKPEDLARFIRTEAENDSTYYLRDATIYPSSD